MEEKKKNTILLQDFAVPPKGQFKVRTCSKTEQEMKCLCEEQDEIGHSCFKCTAFVHHCIEKSNNRGEYFECVSCINKAMDPLYRVRKVLVESYFKIDNIFQCLNQITFEFLLFADDLFNPVEIRALKPGQTSLNYPMQGIFELNQQFLQELRPLKTNSNRKTRREEFIVIPKDRLRIGKNLLRFRIPVLDRDKFKQNYQCQEQGVYYLSVNSIEEMKKQSLIKETFSARRLQKPESIALLTKESGDVQITQTKLCLICPYTKDRIKVPVRGKYCKHFNCICLETLIASHIKSRYWGCPICDSKIAEPFVDIWIYGMLKDNKNGTDVLVQADGTYQWIINNQEPVSIQSEEEEELRQTSKQVIDNPLKLFNPQAMKQSHLSSGTGQHSSKEQSSGADPDEPLKGDEGDDGVSNAQKVKKLLRESLKQKVLSFLQPDVRMEVEVERKGEIHREKVVKGPIFVRDVQERRVKEQSYNSFRKKNMQNQLVFSKKMNEFIEEHPNLRSIFKEVMF